MTSPQNLSDAQAAIEANLRTPEGKAFDEQMSKDFVDKHLGAMHKCKASAGADLTNFWILLKLDKDGGAKEMLLYPSTKFGTCARETLIKECFPTPPRVDYWVGIYMKLSH